MNLRSLIEEEVRKQLGLVEESKMPRIYRDSIISLFELLEREIPNAKGDIRTYNKAFDLLHNKYFLDFKINGEASSALALAFIDYKNGQDLDVILGNMLAHSERYQVGGKTLWYFISNSLDILARHNII